MNMRTEAVWASVAVAAHLHGQHGDVAPEADLAAWLTRRSVAPRRLHAPGPDDRQIALLLAAARNAPDHGRLRPCRLMVLDDVARVRLGHAFQEYRRQTTSSSSSDDAALEMERATNAPTLLAIAARIRGDMADVPAYEQRIAVGAVIGNLMTAANALGFAGKVLSGARARDPHVRAVVCDDEEILVGFVYLGTAA